MILLYAIIGLFLAAIWGYYRQQKKLKQKEQESYQQYKIEYMNPLSFESWQAMEDFKQNLRLSFSHQKPFDGNHYDLDKIMETYPKDRIVRKMYEDLGFKKNYNSSNMSSLGFNVKNIDNLFNFFNLCEEVINTNCSYGFPVNHHFIVVGRQDGVFFISMPYDIINQHKEYNPRS